MCVFWYRYVSNVQIVLCCKARLIRLISRNGELVNVIIIVISDYYEYNIQ